MGCDFWVCDDEGEACGADCEEEVAHFFVEGVAVWAAHAEEAVEAGAGAEEAEAAEELESEEGEEAWGEGDNFEGEADCACKAEVGAECEEGAQELDEGVGEGEGEGEEEEGCWLEGGESGGGDGGH